MLSRKGHAQLCSSPNVLRNRLSDTVGVLCVCGEERGVVVVVGVGGITISSRIV